MNYRQSSFEMFFLQLIPRNAARTKLAVRMAKALAIQRTSHAKTVATRKHAAAKLVKTANVLKGNVDAST